MDIAKNASGETVATLNNEEARANERFNALLDDGKSCVEGMETIRQEFPTVSDEFVRWLGN